MLLNYLRTALRNLLRYKLYSSINVLGLAVGLSCCFLIALFVMDELNYDRHYVNADRIYRISKDSYSANGNRDQHMAAHAPQVAPLLKQDYPEIAQAARIFCCGNLQLAHGERVFLEGEGVQFADNELFEIFDFTWLQGDAGSALAEPFTAVLTAGMAQKYFGNDDPMGGELLLENQIPVRVTGIIADLPHNTHLDFRMLVSMPTANAMIGEEFLNNWGSNNFHTYVLLKEGADISGIQQQSRQFFERHLAQGGQSMDFTAMPLASIHLRSDRAFEMRTPGSQMTVYAFSGIAMLILLIACINFMNLATARSTQRAKEVGVRKAIGAQRGQLVQQFLAESLLLVLIAVVLAVALAELLLPLFRTFVQQQLAGYLNDPLLLCALLLMLTLGIGMAAGAYPAFYLSAFRPARVLKGDLNRGSTAVIFRKALVVTQFSITVVLLIATGAMLQQMRFANALDLGYSKDGIVVLSGTPSAGMGSQWETLKQQLLAHPEILGVSASNIVPGTANTSMLGVRYEGGGQEGRGMPYIYADYGFFETYGIETLAGRTFSADFATDKMLEPDTDNPQTTGAYVLNALAASQLGWTPEEAIGKWFEVGRSPGFQTSVRGPIVGVVADVYFESLHNALQPMVYMIPPAQISGFSTLREASIKISGNNVADTLRYIDSMWAQFVPGQPLQRRFLDADFEALYLKETRQVQIFVAFSMLAIFIACLGLFGLASYTTERRTREIGVRKVMGGSLWSIVLLLTNDFSKLVLLSNLIAWPVAYFAMNRWLENFAYRIDLTPLMFIGSGLCALCIAWITVGGTAAKAASAKPVLALRYE